MHFRLSDKEEKAAEKWMKKRRKKYPDNGKFPCGRFTYTFTPSGIGMVVTIRDNAFQIEKDITDVSVW